MENILSPFLLSFLTFSGFLRRVTAHQSPFISIRGPNSCSWGSTYPCLQKSSSPIIVPLSYLLIPSFISFIHRPRPHVAGDLFIPNSESKTRPLGKGSSRSKRSHRAMLTRQIIRFHLGPPVRPVNFLRFSCKCFNFEFLFLWPSSTYDGSRKFEVRMLGVRARAKNAGDQVIIDHDQNVIRVVAVNSPHQEMMSRPDFRTSNILHISFKKREYRLGTFRLSFRQFVHAKGYLYTFSCWLQLDRISLIRSDWPYSRVWVRASHMNVEENKIYAIIKVKETAMFWRVWTT
jgi:hypothetical protein